MATTIAGYRHRNRLFKDYEEVIQTNRQLDRSLVSFQANRKLGFYSWLKYKEGFSARLVDRLLDEYGLSRGTLLDPFAGIGTSLFVARDRGLNAIGIELMPIGFLAMEARLCAERVSPQAFSRKARQIDKIDWQRCSSDSYALHHIPITERAFSPENELAISGYRSFCSERVRDVDLRKLFQVAGVSILEDISYTRKDGQYLRWDLRSKKPRVTAQFHKGEIKKFDEALRGKLLQIERDLKGAGAPERSLFAPIKDTPPRIGCVDLRKGSCLELLPQMPDSSVDVVVTSPPYCNRYDYTRTYALELVYLDLDRDDVKRLRQAMLSCTVENQAKTNELRQIYESIQQIENYHRVLSCFERSLALHEVLEFLESEATIGELNNQNIPRMVRNYFLEMCVVVFELSRVLRPEGRVFMVNDNVRYAGEEVPVDLILSDFARCFGFEVERIWTLPRGKGNSSQQMGVHGRSELRKCVYVWRKL